MRKFLSLILLLLPFALSAGVYTVEEIPNVQLADRTKLLSDPDGILSPGVAAQIDSLLCGVRRTSGAEVAAVIVEDIDDDDIDIFATDLYNHWRLGDKASNSGVLVVVAKDSHQAAIRTGYGTEGILPDILTGRILRNEMFPRFRVDDYDGGMLLGIKEICRLLNDPAAVAELTQQIKRDESDNIKSTISIFLKAGFGVGVLMLAWLIFTLYRSRSRSSYEKYLATNNLPLIFWVLTIFFLGTPLIASLPLTLLRRHWRNHARNCPRCGTRMEKLDEATDNQYLNVAQDLEERIKSVDYDVWKCPQCGDTEIERFVNERSMYKECDACHARTLQLKGATMIKKPTYSSEGLGEKKYVCLNCHHTKRERYSIPRKEDPNAAGAVLGAISGRGFGSSSGGSSGGGFGGGLTGGGGASGRW